MARWPLKHLSLPDNYRLSQKQSIFAGEIYMTTCVEWDGDHISLGLIQIDPLLKKICAKNDFLTCSQ